FVCVQDPGDPKMLHGAMRTAVEGAILALLSSDHTATVPTFCPTVLALLAHANVTDLERAVAAFGFRPHTESGDTDRDLLAAVRGELAPLGIEMEGDLRTLRATVEMTSTIAELEQRFVDMPAPPRWGDPPGALAERLLEFLDMDPTAHDLRALSTVEAR